MISSKDRSFYIGASDVSKVVGNWETKTFEKWYMVKQGYGSNDFTNDAMMAGTFYEHAILDSLDILGLEKDKQIIIGRLRVNLDGNTNTKIYEVKTHNAEKVFKVSKGYREQVLVQMYGSGIKKACIVAYGLTDKEYNNFYLDIDKMRISLHEIEYDEDFINNNFLPKLRYLSKCLDDGRFPNKQDFEMFLEVG